MEKKKEGGQNPNGVKGKESDSIVWKKTKSRFVWHFLTIRLIGDPGLVDHEEGLLARSNTYVNLYGNGLVRCAVCPLAKYPRLFLS